MCISIIEGTCCFQDILYADDDEQIVLPDPAEKFDELLSRFAYIYFSSIMVVLLVLFL